MRVGVGNEDFVTDADQRFRAHPTLESAVCIPAGMTAPPGGVGRTSSGLAYSSNNSGALAWPWVPERCSPPTWGDPDQPTVGRDRPVPLRLLYLTPADLRQVRGFEPATRIQRELVTFGHRVCAATILTQIDLKHPQFGVAGSPRLRVRACGGRRGISPPPW
jgi:hypothetical protein